MLVREKRIYILYIGSLEKNSNSFRRFETLKKMGAEVIGINVDNFILAGPFTPFHYHLNLGPGVIKLNRTIKKLCLEQAFNIIWVDNKTYITPETLTYIKRQNPLTKIINVVTDDPFGKVQKHWRLFRKTIKLFDHFFVQRTANIMEFRGRGAMKFGFMISKYLVK